MTDKKTEKKEAKETSQDTPKSDASTDATDAKAKDEKGEVELTKNAQKVMEMVEKMTVLELNDLVKALEDKFGVSASAPMMMGAMPAVAGGASAEPAEEKTEFDVVLTEVGGTKISVIKTVHELKPSMGLVDANKLIASTPATILEGVKKAEAESAKKKLEEAGAKVELK